MSLRDRIVGCVALLATSACSPSNADPPGSEMPPVSQGGGGGIGNFPAAGALPCAVQQIFDAKCKTCHDSPPVYGAPMPLVDYDDTQALLADTKPVALGRDAEQKKAYLRISERIHATSAPMPQGGSLTPQEMQTLDTWIQGGAQPGVACAPPPGAGGTGTVGAGGGTMNPNAGGASFGGAAGGGSVGGAGGDSLGGAGGGGPIDDPGTCYDIDVRARADATGAPFPVPRGTSELYQCFSFHVDLKGATQGLSFKKLDGNKQVIHHWLLYGMDTPQNDGTSSPCIGAHADGALMAGWAPGNSDWILPDDVGLRLPANGDFILEVHYNNYTDTDQTDNSGVRICAAKTPRPNTASISWLGNDNFGVLGLYPGIPAFASDVKITGNCIPQPALTEPVHIIKSWPHMHLLGRHMEAVINRAGGNKETLFSKDFDFNNQIQYDTPTIINPGDTITTTCTFDNSKGAAPVSFGERTVDEMCFNFTVAYPEAKLVGGPGNAGIHKNECFVP